MELKIGKLALENNLIAAPLAGYSDRVWRKIVHECGAGLAFSEMAAVEGLIRAHKKTEQYLLNFDDARPFGIQLFGSNPESYERVFKTLARHKIDVVDINAGCPVKKVVAHGAGAALMKATKVIEAILKSCRSVYSGPLTLKIRSGWDENSLNAADIARIAEACGTDAVIVHPRTKVQGFTGLANWSIIKDVVKAVQIPVIGNGDIKDINDAKRMLEETGCAGIMIGRAALFNPLIFREILENRPAPLDERLKVMLRHFELAVEHLEPRAATNTVKKFVPKYLRGLPGHRETVKKACQAKTARESLEGLKETFK